jgi:hypothetical protein
VKTFVKYVLTGFYGENKKANKSKKLWVISKSAFQRVLGTTRIGSAQREDLFETCIKENVGCAELSDRFIFFAPDDILGISVNMTEHVEELKKLTDEFDKLKKTEADREWAERFE